VIVIGVSKPAALNATSRTGHANSEIVYCVQDECHGERSEAVILSHLWFVVRTDRNTQIGSKRVKVDPRPRSLFTAMVPPSSPVNTFTT
jgi:hypothetical protein